MVIASEVVDCTPQPIAETHDWYLVQCRPNCHAIAERNLQRQGDCTFLPLQSQTRRVGSKFVTDQRPLFPGYMFLGLRPDHQPWRAVNCTYGVSRLVAFTDHPAQVPPGFVENLRLRCDASGLLMPPPVIAVGDNVRVLGGSFADFLATVETITAESRVWVLLELMGRTLRMELSHTNVARA